MTKCKKVNRIDGVRAKVAQSEERGVFAEFTFIRDSEPEARVRMSAAQLNQFNIMIQKMLYTIARNESESEFRITD